MNKPEIPVIGISGLLQGQLIFSAQWMRWTGVNDWKIKIFPLLKSDYCFSAPNLFFSHYDVVQKCITKTYA